MWLNCKVIKKWQTPFPQLYIKPPFRVYPSLSSKTFSYPLPSSDLIFGRSYLPLIKGGGIQLSNVPSFTLVLNLVQRYTLSEDDKAKLIFYSIFGQGGGERIPNNSPLTALLAIGIKFSLFILIKYKRVN